MISIRACAATLRPTNLRVGFDQDNITRFVEAKLSALLHESIAGQATVEQPSLQLVIENIVLTTAAPTLHSDGSIIVADFEFPGFDGENIVVGLRRGHVHRWQVVAVAICERLEVPSDDVVLMIALLGDDRFAYTA